MSIWIPTGSHSPYRLLINFFFPFIFFTTLTVSSLCIAGQNIIYACLMPLYPLIVFNRACCATRTLLYIAALHCALICSVLSVFPQTCMFLILKRLPINRAC